ncbi:hypothetical protein FIU82_17945 (plasmid) [Pseudoalteromonas sp. THAF3]|uniref:hypothetical protein n=1 Tax=Pseudoalteromonas sp. THAF3 TaxID=2587843 RepID=UPI001268BC8E|nr:hypothetical protein [Pseudoalteromonas sp. THAF3]QFU06880.1 hypothetical protein FIU82_17945 [Pseudoalteromonas sp. THAF3]
MSKIIFLVFSIFSLSAHATSLKNENNLSWLLNNYDKVEETVSRDKSYELIPVTNTLVEIWYHRDGATTAEVSIPIIMALIHHPDIMLPMLADNPDSFDRWLSQFNGIVFMDFSGESFDELTSLKVQLAESMSSFSQRSDHQLKPFVNKLLKQLEVTEVRTVN